jgi:hypothetical protein
MLGLYHFGEPEAKCPVFGCNSQYVMRYNEIFEKVRKVEVRLGQFERGCTAHKDIPLFSRKSLKEAKCIGKDAEASKEATVGIYDALATSRDRWNHQISTLLAEI